MPTSLLATHLNSFVKPIFLEGAVSKLYKNQNWTISDSSQLHFEQKQTSKLLYIYIYKLKCSMSQFCSHIAENCFVG